MPCGHLFEIDQAALDQHVPQAERPPLVIRGLQIDFRRKILDRRARLVDVPEPRKAHRAIQREAAAFPFFMERRLVRFRPHRPEAVHAAHVVNAVHGGGSGSPVPTMQSRVTSVASFSSLQPSVPGGRMGTTMNRVSAVESHTRITVCSGNTTPKSASTPRGSITARDRYADDLYQVGGNPSTSHG